MNHNIHTGVHYIDERKFTTMKKYGIYYGSATGTTREVAERIAKELGVDAADIHNVAEAAPSSVADYETLVLGSSTWGSGDLEDDWFDFVAGIESMFLGGKRIALFGVGDENMSDTFCDAVGKLYDRLQDTKATFIGQFNVDGYDFKHSDAVRDGMGVGLLLDENNHADLTDGRIKAWTATIA